MKIKRFKTRAIKTSEVPNHIHCTMFIKDEIYWVSESINLIEMAVKEKWRQYKLSAGAMTCDMTDVMLAEIDNQFKKEAKQEEEFCIVNGKFQNSLGGYDVKELYIKKSICKEYLMYV